jgi:hypothetical protein
MPITRCSRPAGARVILVGLGCHFLELSTPRSMVLRVPPDCWIVM